MMPDGRLADSGLIFEPDRPRRLGHILAQRVP